MKTEKFDFFFFFQKSSAPVPEFAHELLYEGEMQAPGHHHVQGRGERVPVYAGVVPRASRHAGGLLSTAE